MDNEKQIARKEHNKEYYEKNKGKIKAYHEKNKEHRKEYLEKNKEKIKAYRKEYAVSEKGKGKAKTYYSSEKGKATYRKVSYKNKYGITLDEYNIMFDSQNGCCKICKTHQSELTKALAVDHCHDTLKVRGLLCDHCNTGLGKFKDNIECLQKAIDYLKI